jgi:DsbC/DsbD-like thiol-disulfide interchange protein
VASSATVKAEDVTAKVSVAPPPPGDRRLGVTVAFDVGPGWHIYGEPLPTDFTATKVKFDSDLVQSQSLKFPPPKPVHFETLGQNFPVYQGDFTVTGDVALKPSLAVGNYQLGGTIEFQECNDSICKMPQQIHFTLPIVVESAPKA